MFPTRSLTAAALSVAGLLLGAGTPATAADLTARRGDTLPIYLAPAALAEAEKPGADPAAGGGFWNPGPERFRGWALRDLRDYLQRATGAKHPLTAADPKAKGGVFAGTFAQFPDFRPQAPGARKAFESADPEAFVVEIQGDRLFVLGKTDLGLIAGVYTFLDRLGCKWFAPGTHWETVPAPDGLVFDDKLNASAGGPSYRARHFFPSWGPNTSILHKGERERDYALWCLRNRLGGSAYVANFHNDTGMVPPELFDKRPELFALVKDKRNPYALSRAHPDTVAMAVESAVKYLKENEGKGSFYDSFSVETNDGSPACEWSLKKIAAAKVGQPNATDLNYYFANRVAEGIEKAGLKDRWVGMCSYADHAGIPSFDLHPRVAVQVTTALDFSSGMTVEQRLDGLRKRKAQRLGVYHYLNLLTWSLDRPGAHPVADPLGVAADLKRWHDHGATSYMAETSDSWVNGGPGHYLAARVLWDVGADPRKELDAYYAGAYGPAAGEIRALHEDWLKFGTGKVLPRIDRGNAARWHHLISTAERKAGGDAALKARLNDVKRYYLYLDHIRVVDLDAHLPGAPSREERLLRLARYVGSNRGEGAFHAIGLLPTWLVYMPPGGVKIEPAKMGPEFAALTTNITDEKAWKAFPPLGAAAIDKLFAAARLPLDGRAADPAVLDPALKLFPAEAKPPAEVTFPKLHGPPTQGGPRRYVLRVVAPTPKLTFQISAGNPLGGGTEKRTSTVTGDDGAELKHVEFKVGDPVTFELTDVKPGVYTVLCPDFGAEQLTVRGGNTFGAVRASDDWGFNPFRPADLKAGEDYRAYFLVPAGAASLRVQLSLGTVTLGFQGGDVIAAGVKGSPKLQKEPAEFKFAAADKPRVAYVKWAGEFHLSQGLVVEGATLFSPDPAYVLYESLK